MDFDGLGRCFHYGRNCCLCAEFYGPDGPSILESVVLKVWGIPKVWEPVSTPSLHVLPTLVTEALS